MSSFGLRHDSGGDPGGGGEFEGRHLRDMEPDFWLQLRRGKALPMKCNNIATVTGEWKREVGDTPSPPGMWRAVLFSEDVSLNLE